MKSVSLLISITSLFLFVSCGNTAKVEEVATSGTSDSESFTFDKEVLKEKGIVAVPITPMLFYQTYWATGKIGVPPEDQTLVLSPFEGRLNNFKWMPGQTIEKGAVLGTIASVELLKIQSDFQAANADYVRLTEQFERDQQLFEEQIIPLKVLQNSRSELERAAANRKGLLAMASLMSISESQLSGTHPLSEVAIRAPFTGELSEVTAQNGSIVTSNAPLATITAVGHKHIEFEVFESVVRQFNPGDGVEVYALNDSTDKEGKPAKIHLIGSAVESVSNAVPIHADFDQESEHNRWILGQFARVKLKARPEVLNALPAAALLQIENGNYALKIIGQTDKSITVARVKLELLNRKNQTHQALAESNLYLEHTEFLSGNILDLLW